MMMPPLTAPTEARAGTEAKREGGPVLLVAKQPSSNTLKVPVTVNPFELPRLSFSPLQYVKMALVGCSLFPLRLATLLLSVAGISALSFAATIGHNHTRPLPTWRSALLQPIKPLNRLVLWALGFWHIRVDRLPGSAPRGKAGVLVAAPHFSLIDPFVMAWLELPISVSKAAVGKMPGVGRIAKAMQTIFVDRKDPSSKKKTVQAIIERAKSSEWPPVLVFPEGTCTNGSALISFKPGAFLPGIPVQPVFLDYQHDPANGLCLSAAVEDANLRLLLAMLQFNNTLKVTYLPLHEPTEAEVADKASFAAATRERMASFAGLPTTSHSYEDVWLASKARRFGVKQTFEVTQLQSLFNLTADGITTLLERFHALDTSRDGLLGLDEFRSALSLQQASTAWVTRLFSFFDGDGSGAISYAEFVQGLAILSPSTSPEEKVKLAFLLCDLDAAGGVTLANLLHILSYAKADETSAAAPTDGSADGEGGVTPAPPFLQRSGSTMERDFLKFDANNDKVLDFDEFRNFLAAHPDVLALSTSVVHSRLGQSNLLSPLQETVGRIKEERGQK